MFTRAIAADQNLDMVDVHNSTVVFLNKYVLTGCFFRTLISVNKKVEVTLCCIANNGKGSQTDEK